MQTRVTPYRTATELLEGVATCVVESWEGDGTGIRSRAVVDLRIAATAELPDGAPYARALAAWRLDPVATWLLHAAVVREVSPDVAAATVADGARLACAVTGARPFEAYAAVVDRLARLALIRGATGALHEWPLCADPRVVELALGVEASPLYVARDPELELAGCDPALVDRIADALAASAVARPIGDRACIPAIVAVAADYGWPTVLAGAAQPGVAVREALLADGALVVEGGPRYHPAWREAPRGVLVVT